jgi:hypothetical protein
MSRHTLAPWQWDGDPTDYNKEDEAPWLVADAGLTVILSGEIEARNKADVALIASAPELLEALQLIVECFPKEVLEDQLGEYSYKIFYAIKKATE